MRGDSLPASALGYQSLLFRIYCSVNVGNSHIVPLIQFLNDAILRLVEQYVKWSPAQCIGGTCSLLLLGDFCGGRRIGLVSHRQSA